jgi:hypothetical protein
MNGEPAQGLAEPEPARHDPQACARCGERRWLVYVPAGPRGGGVRLCRPCLERFDQVRQAPPATDA